MLKLLTVAFLLCRLPLPVRSVCCAGLQLKVVSLSEPTEMDLPIPQLLSCVSAQSSAFVTWNSVLFFFFKPLTTFLFPLILFVRGCWVCGL